MPAASVESLRDFESHFDTLLAAILEDIADAHSLQLAGHGTTDVLVAPRIEYEFAENEPQGPANSNLIAAPGMNAPAGSQIAFSGTITIRHVYDHTKVSSANAGAVRGALRTLFSPESAAIDATNLPYFEIAALTVVGAQRGRFKDEKEKLLTEFFMTLAVSWYIRESAWPT